VECDALSHRLLTTLEVLWVHQVITVDKMHELMTKVKEEKYSLHDLKKISERLKITKAHKIRNSYLKDNKNTYDVQVRQRNRRL